MPKYTSSEFRAHLADAIRQADIEKTEIVARDGTVIAVLVSPRVYGELHDAWEDQQDIIDAEKAREEGGDPIPWEQVKKDLGWVDA